MHEAALYRAAQPEPTVVLGMLLRPLSLGHLLAISGQGLERAASSGRITPVQLTALVLICCQSWEESKAVYSDRLLSLKMWLWKRRVLGYAKRYAKAKVPYFLTETGKFMAYLTAGALDFPETEFKSSDRSEPGRPWGTPIVLIYQQWLMTHFGMKESQAWDYPLGLCKMRWACHWEIQGGVEIKNREDEQRESGINRLKAEDAAARKAATCQA